MRNAATLCDNCYRLARGYWIQYRCNPAKPEYAACSTECANRIFENIGRNNGVIDKTHMERAAIRSARKPFAEALTEMGLMPHFMHRTADEIDRLIEAAWDGCSTAMTKQQTDLNDEIPF